MEAPISASLGAIGSLIRKLDLLLESSEEVTGCRPRSHKGAKYGMHLLRDDLAEISSYLQDLSELEDPPLIAKCWMKEARELSYDIEDYIDRFVFSGHVANIKTRCRRISHIKIARLVETNKKLIRRKRVAAMISDFRIYTQEAIERHKRYELDCSNFRRRFEPAGRLPTTYEEEADIIIHCGMNKFMDSLNNGRDEQLKVVSVVGSGGIGKTTFVTVLYKKLKGHFDCGAFVRLTRKPDIKTMLRDILTQVQRQQTHHDHGEDPDLIGKIREHLQHKRYLIIIDDLWSASIWDVISHAFPGGGMCSRIIATTQIEDVALACCCYHSDYVFEMRPLDDDLSRKLFFNGLFCSESDFPHKMKEVSNKIIKICGGSPLATTIIARLLASHPVMLMEQWTYIYDSLSFNLRTCSTSEGLLKLIVNFSYNNLTHHLKTCLLYLSMYPEGCTVCKDDLVKQWVAEGFIDATRGREVKIAESYFHELIARRFLQPADIRYNSEVVSCSVHDVVRDLVVQKSLEENFIMVLDCYRRNVSLSEKVHRLSLHFPHAKYARTNIRSSQVRSLAYFGLSKCMPSMREFKLIRVLNLGLSGHEDGDDTIDLTGIYELLQLRYLKVASDVCIELPKHMRRLHYLETLDIGTKITHVPWDIIHLPCLLHLHLPFETNLMDWISAIPASVWSHGKLTNLQNLHLTCSIPVPDHLQRNMEALGSLLGGHGNLKTLALILGSAHKNFVHSPSEVTFSWDEFAPLLLERFEWSPHIFTFSRVPKWMGKLGNLRILKISVRELLRDGVNILGDLYALTALSLYLHMAPVKRIVFDNKAGFAALKYFKLICSTVPCLKFEMYTLPNLKRLKLGFSAHRVDQHGTTPISIEHLPGLEEISAKVWDARSDAETALTAAISNHPRNPRIRVQLVDWSFCGDGVWYMEPRTLEEDEILEDDLDEECVLQYEDSRNDEKKEDYVRNGGDKRRREENCSNNVKSQNVSISPSIIGERSVLNSCEHSTVSSSYASKAACAFQKITNECKASASSSGISSTMFPVSGISEATSPQQRNRARGASGRCIAHGGGRRCQKPGCQKGAEGRTIYCKAHVGGRRCQFLGCTKSAEGRTDHCIAHGGGHRCSHEGCSRAARGKSGLCIKHGGGKRCQKENCTKSAEGHSGLCIAHGGGRRGQFPDGTKGAQGSTKFCKAHGGGKRCTFLGCTRGAEGSTAFCKGHGGGKRCAFQGGGVCPKSVLGGTQYCVAHGGGKRCAISGCTMSARGRTEYCVRHGGGKRCKFEGCGKSAQGSTDFCKAHGGGKRCSWGQVDSSSGAGAQPCDRLARGKSGLCLFHRAVSSSAPKGGVQSLTDTFPQGRVHGRLLALLSRGGSSTSAGGSENCASGKMAWM
ncbi:hypothetical protein SEVIR_5G238300v4 [Setaria viridis]